MKHAMRMLFFLTVMVTSLSANAGCTYIAEHYSDKLFLEISDGGCGELTISFTDKGYVFENGGAHVDYASIKSFPFNEECKIESSKDIYFETLTCHESGRTPLAGTMYKLKATGKYRKYDDCNEPIEDGRKIEIWQYVCVSGCNKKGVPRTLDQKSVCD